MGGPEMSQGGRPSLTGRPAVIVVVISALLLSGLPWPLIDSGSSRGAPPSAPGSGSAGSGESTITQTPAAGPSAVESPALSMEQPELSAAHPPSLRDAPAHGVVTGSSPRPAVVNVNALYSTEPAPMGVADFGISGATGYTYYASQFLGQTLLTSTNAKANGGYGGNYVSYQLNVVLVMTHGSSTTAYWIQDVPILNTSSRYFFIEDNIWNMSSSPSTIPSTTLSGNGTTYAYSGTNTYYADGPSSSYSGNYVTLTYPINISAKVVSSVVSGVTHVGFQYNDGYGWVTYDNVSFPWSKGWADRGFEVNGTSYNGYGTFYDAEWVVCGPGSSSNAAWSTSTQLFALAFYNGHNFEPVLNAYNFGSDTAETATNVLESLNAGGVPAAQVGAGSGALASLYTRSNLGIINVSISVKSGTLLVNGNATSYVGNEVNLTLLPGGYRLTLKNGSAVLGTRNITVSAGGYQAISFLPALALSNTTGPGGTSVTAGGSFFTPGSTATVTWSASGSTLCTATVVANGRFACKFTVPAAKASTYRVNATDSSSSLDKASATFTETTNLAVSASVSHSTTDVGLNLTFTATATGGYTPYASYAWNFGDGSKSTVTTTTATHAYSSANTYSATVVVTDYVGSTANGSQSVRVNADPTASTPKASPASVDLGQSTKINTTASAGTGSYTYTWSGLPTGCSGTAASVSCKPTGTGTVNLTVTVTDSSGYSVTTSALKFTTYPDLTVSKPSANLSSVDVQQTVNLSTTASGGSSGYSYTWSGLPTGCSGTNASVRCTPTGSGTFTISVNVTDSNAYTVSSASVNYTVYADPTASTPSANRTSVDLGQSVTFRTTTTVGSGNLTYAWSNLPSGCSGTTSTMGCTPTGTGTFTVTVKVTDANGFAVASSSLGFTVYALPTTSTPAATPASVDVGQSVTFRAAVSLGSGGYTYAWSGLPSGCSGTTDPLPCTVTGAGTFTITLQATDSNGESATSGGLTFTAFSDPTVATPTASATSVDVGQQATLSSSASLGSGGYTYLWSGLPTGCSGTTRSVSCTPTASGTFHVTVTLTDSNGFAVASTALSFTVYADPAVSVPVAAPRSIDLGQIGAIMVTATSGSGGLTYAWSGLPTGCTATGATVTCLALASAGTFTISVRVNDSNGFVVTSASLVLSVFEDPAVVLAANRTAFDQGEALGLTATASLGSGGFVYRWTGLPPGCGGAAAHLSCSPSAAGTFRVAVTVTDSNGASESSIMVELTIAPPLGATLSASPVSPTAGVNVSFMASVTGGTGPIVYTWVFGDGAKGTGPSVGHVFGSAGSYTVSLWVNDTTGAFLAKSLVVTVARPPASGTLLGLTTIELAGLVVAAGVILVVAGIAGSRRPKA